MLSHYLSRTCYRKKEETFTAQREKKMLIMRSNLPTQQVFVEAPFPNFGRYFGGLGDHQLFKTKEELYARFPKIVISLLFVF